MKRHLALISLLMAAVWCAAQPYHNKEHFVWGASLCTDIDMSQHDMSSVGIDGYAGIETGILDLIGAGAKYSVSINTPARFMPVFMIVRTNFQHTPSLCFAEMRGGVCISYPANDSHQTGAYFSAGMGINLASNQHFTSHLFLGYAFLGNAAYALVEDKPTLYNVHAAFIRIGITF